LPHERPMTVDIAIVGAGAVGVAIATRLAGRTGRIALIEAGGFRFDPAKQKQFFGADRIADPRHPPGELYRRRMLGGTTSIWGGRCIPLDLEDFLPAPGHSGWPIGHGDVAAYVPDALEFLQAGRPEFGAAGALPTLPLQRREDAGDLDLERVERFSEPTNVWKKWGTKLVGSPDVTVIYEAACTAITTNAEGRVATGLQLRTASNKPRSILASSIVVACGGLETPRLLLASRAPHACGLGNAHDLVGRCYMTHLAGVAGSLHLTAEETVRSFDYGVTPDGIYARRLIRLTPPARQRRGIGNIVFRPTITSIDDASHRDPVLSAMFVAKRLIIPEYARRLADPGGKADPGRRLALRDHFANIGLGLPKLVGFGGDWLRRRVFATRKLPSVFLRRADATYPLEFNAEQLPNPESRVLLGSEVDPYGMPRLIIRWATGDDDITSIARAYEVLEAGVGRSGLGTLQRDPDLLDTVRRAVIPLAGHHMGTARMGGDPLTGVVDRNAEVWGTHGLFVAGAAIFPTGGFANPTLTAVALALRLADHLVQLRRQAGTESGAPVVGGLKCASPS